ncbi:MAG: acyl-CoA desaturase [Mycobacteriaceae bacterium]
MLPNNSVKEKEIEDSVLRSIVQLNPSSAREKKIAALVTIGVPGVGFLIAIFLAFHGHLTVLNISLFVSFYIVQMLGITLGFHRYAAHKTYRTSRFFEGVLMAAGSMALEGPLLFWVATHRRHHRFSDHFGDPHSPNLNGNGFRAKLSGLWWAHIPWMLSDKESKASVFAPDILRDRTLFLHSRMYPFWALVSLLSPALLGLLIGGTLWDAFTAFIFGGLARIFLANQAAWCVGSVSHMIGGKPFKTGDDSANNWLVAFFTFGEGLQNNHHAFPGAYRHGVKWWEPDASGWVLAALNKLRLVWDLRMPDKKTIERRKYKNTPTHETEKDLV